MTHKSIQRILTVSGLLLAGFGAVGCQKKQPAAAGPAMQAMPVQTVTVAVQPVLQSSDYVATIKSRRSATLQPQVSGALVAIGAKSGDHVKAGQVLMAIDPRQQQASVDAQRATERQKKALFDYDTLEQDRQKKLFEAGVTSRDAYDQAQQAYQNAKADYEASVASRKTQEQLLGYYTIRSPYDGVVGDIPVHVGDYVTTSTMLTTVDENKDLEAYIYIPTERMSQVRMGLGVDLTDNNGKLLQKTSINFISSQVDSTLQGILVKAPVEGSSELLRNAQLVKAKVIWSTKPMPVIPVLAVTRQGEQSFVFVVQNKNGMTLAHRTEVTLGDTVGNNYSISAGLNAGDRVIVSATQFLVDGMPVSPLGAPPAGAPHAASAPAAQGSDTAARAVPNSTPADSKIERRVASTHPLHKRQRRTRTHRHARMQTAAVS